MARLIIMCGLPGSGKTTQARLLADELDAVRLSSDEWLLELRLDGFDEEARERVEALQWGLAQRLLELGQNVILEAGFWARVERDALRDGARRLGADVELRVLDVPLKELWRRLERRNADLPVGSLPVTHEQLELWSTWFEVPDERELAKYDPPVGTEQT